MMSYADLVKKLKENSTGKPLTNKDITNLVDEVIPCFDQTLAQTSLVMVKHDFQNFIDSLKTDQKQVLFTHVFTVVLNSKPGLDIQYLRSKFEDLFKEGLIINPNAYLELLGSSQPLTKEFNNWSANTCHTVLEKAFETNRDADLLRILSSTLEKLSTIKVVDLLKKILISEKDQLVEAFLAAILGSRHTKSKFSSNSQIVLRPTSTSRRQA